MAKSNDLQSRWSGATVLKLCVKIHSLIKITSFVALNVLANNVFKLYYISYI